MGKGTHAQDPIAARRRVISEFRANQQIRSDMVRLIGVDGAQLGIVSREEAVRQAEEQGLDLVQVAPQADPPVCKLLDYGKFKYRQKKKRQTQKHHRSRLKGMRIGFASDDHDLGFKADQVREFLKEHDKVEIFMVLRGRQKAHIDMAVEHMKEFGMRFEDVAKTEKAPARAGAGRVSMLLIPK